MAETINTATPDYIVDGTLTDGEAWVPLITNVLTIDAQPITFQSSTGANDWSQYMDLKVIAYCQTNTEIYGIMRFNNDAATNYNTQSLKGDGSTATGSNWDNQSQVHCGFCTKTADGANIFTAQISTIFDINSGKWKTTKNISGSDQNGAGVVEWLTSVWRNQSAITEIDYLGWTGDWKAGSRFDLFGILPRMVTA